MKTMNFSLLISFLSFVLAAIAIYSTHFKPARIKIFSSERISLWHENGILGFDIPIIFSNFGKKPGVIHSMAVIFFNQETKEDILFAKWQWILKFNMDKRSWEQEAWIFPISIEPGVTICKCFNFIPQTSDACKLNWAPMSGIYTIAICAWSKKKKKPNILDRFKIKITEEISNEIRNKMIQNKKVCNYIYRDDFGFSRSKNLDLHELKLLIRKSS